MTNHVPTLPRGTVAEPPAHTPLSDFGIRLLATLVAAAAALFASNNWCLVLFPAALASFLTDYLVCTIRTWFLARVAVAAVVGACVGLLLNVRPGWAFREAFGVDPPSGVQDVRIWRHYLGGPGEQVLIIEFTADAKALEGLLAVCPPLTDGEKAARWQAAGGGWEQAFDVCVPLGLTRFARASWLRIRPLKNTEVFELRLANSRRLTLFHEPATGRCVVLHVRP